MVLPSRAWALSLVPLLLLGGCSLFAEPCDTDGDCPSAQRCQAGFCSPSGVDGDAGASLKDGGASDSGPAADGGGPDDGGDDDAGGGLGDGGPDDGGGPGDGGLPQEVCPCPVLDLDGDGEVDEDDRGLFVDLVSGSGGYDARADLNQDCRLSGADIDLWPAGAPPEQSCAPLYQCAGEVFLNGPEHVDSEGLGAILPCVASVGSALGIEETSLTRISMPALTSVGGPLAVVNNDDLVELSLPSLASVGGALRLWGNGRLPACQAEAVRDALIDEGGYRGVIDVRDNDRSSVEGCPADGCVAAAAPAGAPCDDEGNTLASLTAGASDGHEDLRCVDGQLLIDTNAEELCLPALEHVGSLEGSDASDLALLGLPGLRTAASDVVLHRRGSAEARTELRLGRLEEVPGELWLSGRSSGPLLVVPALRAAGVLGVSERGPDELYLPALQSAGWLAVGTNLSTFSTVQSVRAPALQTVANLVVSGRSLGELVLGDLVAVGSSLQLINVHPDLGAQLAPITTAGTLEVRDSAGPVLALAGPGAVAGDVDITSNAGALELSALTVVDGTVTISGNQNLQALRAGSLETVGSLLIGPADPAASAGRNPDLEILRMNALTEVEGDMRVNRLPQQGSVPFPAALHIGGDLVVSGNYALPSVESLFGDVQTIDGSVTFLTNPCLSDSDVNGWLDAMNHSGAREIDNCRGYGTDLLCIADCLLN